MTLLSILYKENMSKGKLNLLAKCYSTHSYQHNIRIEGVAHVSESGSSVETGELCAKLFLTLGVDTSIL